MGTLMDESVLIQYMLRTILQSIAFPILILVGMYMLAAVRKPSDIKPTKLLTFTTALDRTFIAKQLVEFARMNRLKVDAFDSGSGRMVLGKNPSLLSWGYFIHVYLTKQPTGHTLVEVGIQGRLIEIGTRHKKWQELYFEKIKTFLFAAKN